MNRLPPGVVLHLLHIPGWGWGNLFAWETTVCVQR